MRSTLKKVASAMLLVAAAGFAYFHLRGPRGISALLERREAIHELERSNEELRKDNERRRLRNRELAGNPDAIGLEIRRRLHKLRKGETDFKVTPETAPER